MSKDDYFQEEGIVLEAKGNGLFIVHISKFNRDLLCHLSGKIRKNSIRILGGDKVIVEISMADTDKGRIVFRKK